MPKTENDSIMFYFVIMLDDEIKGDIEFKGKDKEKIKKYDNNNKENTENDGNKISLEVYGTKRPRESITKKNEIKLEFEINGNNFNLTLSFSNKECEKSNACFIFEPKLEQTKPKKDFPQKNLTKEKFLAFYSGLKNAESDNDINDLIGEGIQTFSTQKTKTTVDFFILFYHSFINNCYSLTKLLKIFEKELKDKDSKLIEKIKPLNDLNEYNEYIDGIYSKKEEIPSKLDELKEQQLTFLYFIICLFI